MAKIAIIGGGPKAAALCAKAFCINLNQPQIHLRVFEQQRIGRAWSGAGGYTDGDQLLCTPAERDVGFPYEPGLLDREGVGELFKRFSWQTFLIEEEGEAGYRDWVDRGRRPPPHRRFAEYVRWVIAKSRFPKSIGPVKRISREQDSWTVTYKMRSGAEKTYDGFDGIVFTGPGPARTGFPQPDDRRITNGVNFWKDPIKFHSLAEGLEEAVIIAGSGGTAAAIAAWFAKYGSQTRPVLIVGNQAALFTRTENYFENALFSDEDAWLALDPKERINASERLNRGVVWSSVSETLSRAANVRFRPGRVTAVSVEAAFQGAPAELRVEVTDARGNRSDAASLVIDATGFDPWWFFDLLPLSLRRAAMAAGTKSERERKQDLIETMDDDLSLQVGIGGLHAPMLSLAQGPGFASLMVLGAMSERILRSYSA